MCWREPSLPAASISLIKTSDAASWRRCYASVMTAMKNLDTSVRQYFAASAVMCVIMLNVLDATIVNVALPALAH